MSGWDWVLAYFMAGFTWQLIDGVAWHFDQNALTRYFWVEQRMPPAFHPLGILIFSIVVGVFWLPYLAADMLHKTIL